jgi:hypothetical protein
MEFDEDQPVFNKDRRNTADPEEHLQQFTSNVIDHQFQSTAP